MKGLYVLICCSILLIVLIYIQRRREGFTNSNNNELVIVKASWCGHCKTAMPDFKRLVSASPISLPNGSKVVVRMLDEKDNKSEVDAMSVKGFPTIIYKSSDGKQIEYQGERTYDGVMSFLQSTNS